MPYEEAVEMLKKSIKKMYGKKAECQRLMIQKLTGGFHSHGGIPIAGWIVII
jgi:hypothetical protein